MTAPQEALQSVAERARRALRDNEEARLQAQRTEAAPAQPHRAEAAPAQPQPRVEAQPEPAWHPAPGRGGASGTVELLERRMVAISVLREVEPQRTCFRQRVQELSQRLAQTPTDSVHYPQLLERLAEAHGELTRLEGQVEEAQHVIRSTEWLMEMLSDPTRSWGRPAGQERDAIAR